MKLPQRLRKQIEEYRKAGFTVYDIHPRAGSHWMVRFNEFSQPQVLTSNIKEPRSLKNNIATYRRLAAEEKNK
jgi:hypothetical protein